MIKVKICGLKKKEDVEFLNNFPVDYMGFIMYPKSPRYVNNELKELLSLVKKAKKVVVFVNPSYEEVKNALDLGADFIQLHGEETPEFGEKIGFKKIIKAFRVKENRIDFKELSFWKNAYAILLDTYVKGILGGTGKTFNWDIAKRIVSSGYKVFLAGGIDPDNVLNAVKEVSPYAIDIASGVELYPGKKDPEKINRLFNSLKLISS
ncbi:MAG: N-(5'-phosphoribosyl)anthranilate isomerase [Thermodesulfobacterium geofontis]|uniref:N-(5'-phosphoribosyl)anthranilate isomerase n=2 Tax=Thermodesulfobacterium geofontis TaxID=1295609 RepID=A0A2N7PN83_9BACT|nr:MAG: N-(5'-phosphoribosyl)anthranilate isomerase [Thermodesulfobacterium geofontis]